MNIGEDMRGKLVEAIYRQPGGTREKCIALAHQLENVYAAERLLNEQLSLQNHENFLQLRELHGQVLASIFEPGAPALTQPDKYFTAEEQASAEFKQAANPCTRKGWWAQTLSKAPVTAALIEPEDEAALEFLSALDVVTQPSRFDYSVEFRFEPNPFFHNECLRVDVLHGDGLGEEITELKATPIQWKDGKDLTNVTKTTKGRGKGRSRKTVTLKKKSFFLIFANLLQPNDDDEDEEEEEEESAVDVPPSDTQIFYDACDVMEFLRQDLYTCLVPLMLGVKVGFLGEGETPPAASGKPDCKTQ